MIGPNHQVQEQCDGDDDEACDDGYYSLMLDLD